MNDIYDFIPVYPSITQSSNNLFNVYNNFYQGIFNKKEFLELKLNKFEDVPKTAGILLKNQHFISRFLSSHTPYDNILLFASMGTGKTCSAIGAIEQIKSENSSFKGALILSKRHNMLVNFQEELVFKCTKGQYIPDDFNNLSTEKQKSQLTKKTKEFYQFETFGAFANKIKKQSDMYIIEYYSNLIIVIDEVHNLRPQNKENRDTYQEIHRFLHLVQNCKIMLLSGTPMKDTIDEIASVMNLILPIEENFNNSKPNEFTNEYFKKDKTTSLYKIKDENHLIEFKNKIKGRISYLKAQDSNIAKKFMKKSILSTNNLDNLIVFEVKMSRFQSEIYLQAYLKDLKASKLEDIEDVEEVVEEEEYIEPPVLTTSQINTEFGIMSIESIKPDGNALFESVRKQINTRDNINQMRKKVYDLLLSNYQHNIMKQDILEYIEKWFLKFYNDNPEYLDNSDLLVEFYIDSMLTDINKMGDDIPQLLYIGGEIEIILLSEIYKIKICIVVSSEENTIYCAGDDEFQIIYIQQTIEQFYNIAKLIEKDGAKSKKNVDDTTGFLHHSRQASMFVFPDGSCGTEGFNKYVKKTGVNTFTLSPELRNVIYNSDHNVMLQNLNIYSCKFAECISKILEAFNHPTNKKKIFVYNEYTLSGGGTILFALIFELFGFRRATGLERIGDKGHRYIITTLTQTKDFQSLITRYNENDNIHGEIIGVIIGSQIISEGFSFNNLQQEHILSPHWNYSELDQVIARGVRFGSHKLLQKEFEDNKLDDPELEIFQYSGIPENPSYGKSIDLRMYKVCEIKDKNIKMVERIIKESAVDCALNYDRNFISGKDYERDCEYDECIYQCDDVTYCPLNMIQSDYSTDIIYYTESINNGIVRETILNYFKHDFKADIHDIYNIAFQINFPYVYVLHYLYYLVNEKNMLYNKYNIKCFLKESNNVFYLSDKLLQNDNYLVEYYTRHPSVFQNKKSFTEIVDELIDKNAPKFIDELFSADLNDEAKIHFIIHHLTLDVRERLLEWCVIAKQNNNEEHSEYRDKIIEFFYNFLDETIFANAIISSIKYDMTKNNLKDLRYYDPNILEWRFCTLEEQQLFYDTLQNKLDKIKTNETGYYGYLKTDPIDYSYKFSIVQIQEHGKIKLKKKYTKQTEEEVGAEETKGEEDPKPKKPSRKRKIEEIIEEGDTDTVLFKKNLLKTGQICETFNDKFDLIKVIYALHIEPDETNPLWIDMVNKNISALKLTYGNRKALQTYKIFEKEDINEIRKDIYFYFLKISDLCNIIKTRMIEQNIIIYYP